MTAVGITENVKGDVKKFEIWYSGREEVYVVQVRTPTLKRHPADNSTIPYFIARAAAIADRNKLLLRVMIR